MATVTYAQLVEANPKVAQDGCDLLLKYAGEEVLGQQLVDQFKSTDVDSIYEAVKNRHANKEMKPGALPAIAQYRMQAVAAVRMAAKPQPSLAAPVNVTLQTLQEKNLLEELSGVMTSNVTDEEGLNSLKTILETQGLGEEFFKQAAVLREAGKSLPGFEVAVKLIQQKASSGRRGRRASGTATVAPRTPTPKVNKVQHTDKIWTYEINPWSPMYSRECVGSVIHLAICRKPCTVDELKAETAKFGCDEAKIMGTLGHYGTPYMPGFKMVKGTNTDGKETYQAVPSDEDNPWSALNREWYTKFVNGSTEVPQVKVDAVGTVEPPAAN